MNQDIIVSIIIEMGTRELTEEIPADTCAKHFIEEGRSFLTDAQFEIFFVGCHLPPMENLPSNCHQLDICETGYYGWKNAGAESAKGRYLVFFDSDCRPKSGYLKEAVKILENNPSFSGLSGATHYDGTSFLTRLNTVLCFGYLHEERETLGRFFPMGHNLIIRKNMFPIHPFGPHKARAGGSNYIAKIAQAMGKPLQHKRELQIFHEDMSYSMTTLLEQHLREIYIGILEKPQASHFTQMRIGIQSLPLVLLKRVWRLFRYRKTLHFSWLSTLASIPVLIAYAALDCFTVLLLSFIPSLLKRWVKYHFQEEPVYETSPG